MFRRPGLDPGQGCLFATPSADQLRVEVLPLGIAALDEIELPLAAPPLQALFKQNSLIDGWEELGPYKPVKTALTHVNGAMALVVSMNARGQIRADAGVQRPAISVHH